MSGPEVTFANSDLVIGPRGLPVLVPRPPRTMAEIVRRQLADARWSLTRVRAAQDRRAALARIGGE